MGLITRNALFADRTPMNPWFARTNELKALALAQRKLSMDVIQGTGIPISQGGTRRHF